MLNLRIVKTKALLRKTTTASSAKSKLFLWKESNAV
jgi:hypothetical protein